MECQVRKADERIHKADKEHLEWKLYRDICQYASANPRLEIHMQRCEEMMMKYSVIMEQWLKKTAILQKEMRLYGSKFGIHYAYLAGHVL